MRLPNPTLIKQFSLSKEKQKNKNKFHLYFVTNLCFQ